MAPHGRSRSTGVRRSADGGRRGVVSVNAGPDDEETLGEAAPLVAEWRRLYGGGVDEGDRLERAMAEERMRELEIELIEDARPHPSPPRRSPGPRATGARRPTRGG